jgi:hypothetical protein
MRLFPRYRRPSISELVGTSQAKRRVSRKYRLTRNSHASLKTRQTFLQA